MTCIVGLVEDGEIFMGGDAGAVASDQFTISKIAMPKVFRRDEYVIGYTTSFRMGQILQYCGKLPKPSLDSEEDLDEFMVTKFIPKIRAIFKKEGFVTTDDSSEQGGGTFLVGIRGRLYTIYGDWQCIRLKRGFDAVGCGAQFALGSLQTSVHNMKDIEGKCHIYLALKAAAKLSAGVCKPFTVLD